jgi:hypothetical protein
MNHTPEQIASIVLKVLKDIETPDVSSLSFEEKINLAKTPSTPQETLKVLATDENVDVRCWVAWNRNTSQESLKVLATDEDYYIRCCASRNPNYKKQTLELTSVQYQALEKLIESGQDESLKGLMDT